MLKKSFHTYHNAQQTALATVSMWCFLLLSGESDSQRQSRRASGDAGGGSEGFQQQERPGDVYQGRFQSWGLFIGLLHCALENR